MLLQHYTVVKISQDKLPSRFPQTETNMTAGAGSDHLIRSLIMSQYPFHQNHDELYGHSQDFEPVHGTKVKTRNFW